MTLNKIFFLLFYQILLFSIIFIILNINVAFGCVTTSGNTDTVISSDCTGNYTASGVNDTLTVNSGITMTGVVSFNATNGELLNNGTITTVDNVVKGFARISNITNNGSLINTGGVYVMSFFSTVDF